MGEETSKQQENRGNDGKFLPGKSGNPGGRPEGSKNKFTNLKNVFLEAFEDVGGKDALVNWIKESKRNRRDFYQWITKMLPSSVVGKQDDDGEFKPLNITITSNGNEPNDNNGDKSPDTP